MKKTLLLWLLFMLTFVFGTIFVVSSSPRNSVKELSYNHSYTKAICDQNNRCEDYEVYCNNENVLNMRATGYFVQFPSDWKDLRDEKMINTDC